MTAYPKNQPRYGVRTVALALAAILVSGATAPVSAQRPGGRANASQAQPDSRGQRGHAGGPRGRLDRAGGGMERGPGPPRALWQRMTRPEQARMMTFVEEHFPRMYLELDGAKKNQPKRFAKRMSRIAPEMRRVMETMDVQPERGALMIQDRRLDIEMRRLARQYRVAADDESRSRLRQKLQDASGKAFDCQQQRRAMDIRELEARISELKQRHEEATQMRDELVEQSVNERLDMPDRGGARRGKRR